MIIKKQLYLSFILAYQDIKLRYRRSIIGPFWSTISMGVVIASVGFVFGSIFRSPMEEYLPFLAVGLIVWTFILGTISEGCNVFIDSEHMIKQLNLPFSIFVLKIILRNLLLLSHNILILPFIFLFFEKPITLSILLVIPGIILISFSIVWMVLLAGMFCARYRDLPQIVINLLQVSFYLTPIIWMPNLVPDRMGSSFLMFNPFFHLLEVVRAPFLGNPSSISSWFIVAMIGLLGWIFTLFFYRRLRDQIVYWL